MAEKQTIANEFENTMPDYLIVNNQSSILSRRDYVSVENVKAPQTFLSHRDFAPSTEE